MKKPLKPKTRQLKTASAPNNEAPLAPAVSSKGRDQQPALITPPFRIIRIKKSGGPISKKISRSEAGDLIVDSSACALNRGTATTVHINNGMLGLKTLYSQLSTDEAIVLSNADLGNDEREICTEANYSIRVQQNPDVITRSKRFLAGFEDPGLQLFEVDDHGLPPGQSPPTADEMVGILCKLLPELEVHNAAKLMTHSTSSHIYDETTGELLKGEGGKHLSILLSDQSSVKRLKELLEVRQWANGYGHIHISRDGQQLERTVFDLSVFASERLVFEAGAYLQKGLIQNRPDGVATEGHALDMSKLPDPTLTERELANKAKATAKDATADKAQEIKNQYISEESKKLSLQRSITQHEAELIVRARTQASALHDGDVLTFTDKGKPIAHTVDEVLTNIDQFYGRPMCDPIDPDDGPSKAMILRGPGGQPYIHSFAHGGRRFVFQRIHGNAGAADQALFKFSDLANAHRIVQAFGNQMIATAIGWLVFDGKVWKRDDHLANQKALNLSRLVLADPEYVKLHKQIEHDEFLNSRERSEAEQCKKEWRKFAASCENQSKITAAMKIAETLLWRDTSEMNPDPWAFNVLNGTIDLRTGKLRPHDHNDLITALSPVDYDPNAKCPVFERTLLEIFSGDQSLVDYLQRFLGYGLTGLTSEQKILIPWGDGSNGKSTIMGIVQAIMGDDYCGSAAPKLLENSRSDRHPTEIADLYGKRIVIASETEEGAQLREAFLKLATGGDKLKGRYMHKNFFEFVPTHKFILQTNHKPEVKGNDFAIWRRFQLLPFEVIFGDQNAIDAGDASRLKDMSLSTKLSAEFEGILAWMVQGCMTWQKLGLNPPLKVQAATAAYRDEQDRIGQFLEECCVIAPGKSVYRAEFYQKYQVWAQGSGYHPMGIGKFHKQIIKSGKGKIADAKSSSGPKKKVSIFNGIALLP